MPRGWGFLPSRARKKALGYGLNPAIAPLLGMLSGIGGGMLRDVLVADNPHRFLLRSVRGGGLGREQLVVVVGHLFHIPPAVAAILGAAICFCVRLFAIRRGWQLPVAEVRTDKK